MENILTRHPVIDSILNSFRPALNKHFDKYHNHVYRVFNIALWLSKPDDEEILSIAIAASFHDLGIWTNNTFDYLQPSVLLSKNYLQHQGRASLEKHVSDMIIFHHKLTAYRFNAYVEAFRKADLIDLSFGVFRFGVSYEQLKELNRRYPSKGFHRFILKQAFKNIFMHPLDPLPMMKR